MKKTVNNFYEKTWTVLINAKNRFYECSKQIWIYSKYDVQRENFINVEMDFINAEKYIWLLWNSNMKKRSDLAFKFRKHKKTVNKFLNSEHKIIYVKKRANNFLNNAEQEIILCKIVEIVFTENSEQFLWENNEQF